MIKTEKILLASHGTPGSNAAVQAALALGKKGTVIHHLTVVPTLWQGMTGDDWLNNGSTRDTYRRYLESELGREVDEHCDEVQQQAEASGFTYQKEIVLGEPEQCLIDCSNEQACDLIVIGSPRPKGMSGIRSRMHTEPLVKSLTIPLLVIPYPYE
ncbi:MAG: universal stress protein [Xanthomonadales bacterium]|nr:universal stress protein [Xanthomonadales bacterium]